MKARRGSQADFRVLEEVERDMEDCISLISSSGFLRNLMEGWPSTPSSVLHEYTSFDDVPNLGQYAVPDNVLPPKMPPIREDEDAQAFSQELALLLRRTRTADFKIKAQQHRTPTPTPPYHASWRSSRAASGRRWADLRR